ncbi:cfbc40a4-3bd3-4805-b172-c5698e3d5822 [Thermothielavioides terrestris]|uniref:Cfbc40a4-3bd3-4805-b172-c5698e3d5822 n=1 Tax=Thermothielavioides terrestris TaxID=2587410 RepID=A0A3S4AT81_9PEZI|nr:cfbc40a4-3bd3-4805-b172-c5698e3d5822 [Thermothielavioides terrestris]
MHDFFTRNGLLGSARLQCWRFAESLYPSSALVEAPSQGHCSYTLLLREHDSIIQFRPPRHRLDLVITAAARAALGDLVPDTQLLGTIHFPCASSDARQQHNTNDNNNSSSSKDDNDNDRCLLVYSLSLIRGTPLPALLHSLFPNPPPALPPLAEDTPTPTPTLTLTPTPPIPTWTRTSTLSPPPTFTLNPPLTPTETQALTLTPLLRALAHRYFAPAFRAALPATSPRLPALKRRVGRSLRARLALLREGLPARFGPVVREVQGALACIAGVAEVAGVPGGAGGAGGAGEEVVGGDGGDGGGGDSLPWAVTHGDLVGAGVGNVMVEMDRCSGGAKDCCAGVVRLTGLVDWAEGEYLPFGVGLYGLEELLGRMVPVAGTGRRRFEYYPCAERLRAAFWEELEAAVPELVEDAVLRARVEKARLLGLLLWYGIAFDDGALNRVVRPGRDDEELQKLDLFLLGKDHDRDADAAAEAEEDAGRDSDSDSGCFFLDEEDAQTDDKVGAQRPWPAPGKL